MKIGLDFDGTFTEDPELWNHFISNAEWHGHVVFIVTCRPDDELPEIYQQVMLPNDQVFATNGSAKDQYMRSQGIEINIWIDNEPRYINEDKW